MPQHGLNSVQVTEMRTAETKQEKLFYTFMGSQLSSLKSCCALCYNIMNGPAFSSLAK